MGRDILILCTFMCQNIFLFFSPFKKNVKTFLAHGPRETSGWADWAHGLSFINPIFED